MRRGKLGGVVDYTEFVPFLADAVINYSGYGSAVASVKLEEIAKTNPELVIPYVLDESLGYESQRKFLDCLYGLYDERVEELAYAFTQMTDDNLKHVGLNYLASVGSKYALKVIGNMQNDSAMHNRERAGIALAKLIEVKEQKLSKE